MKIFCESKFALLFLLTVGIAMSGVAFAERNDGARITNQEGGADQMIAGLKERALAGSKVAAQQLVTIYMKTDEKRAMYWAQIGAENGDPVAQYNLADILLSNEDAQGMNRVRALFWLNRASSLGNKYAKDRLSEERKRKLAR